MSIFTSTKILDLGSCTFRQWRATHTHCSYLHGYKLYAKLWIECVELDKNGWSFDFGGFKDIKKQLEYLFDHTTIVAQDDPYIDKFKELHQLRVIDLRVVEAVGIEKTAELVHKIANDYILKETKERCFISKVEVWEHDKNSAIYNHFEAITERVFGSPYESEYKTVAGSFNNTSKTPTNYPVVVDPDKGTVADTTVQPDTSVPVATQRVGEILPSKVGNETISTTNNQKPSHVVQGVPVGNRPTTGYGNLFKGTSWGTK